MRATGAVGASRAVICAATSSATESFSARCAAICISRHSLKSCAPTPTGSNSATSARDRPIASKLQPPR